VEVLEDVGDEARSVRFRSSENGPCFDGAAAFSRMRTAWKKVIGAHRGQLSESVCILAGHTIRIRGIGTELTARIEEPFRHLRSDTRNAPGLKIDVWDEDVVAFPCPVETLDASLRSRYDYGYVIGSPQDRFIGCQGAQMVTWFDRASGRIIGCVARRDQLSVNERGKPFHFPLLVWHTDRDVPVIHAGLISCAGQGVLLGGKGDTGKSTVAMACLDAGFDYIGDDYVGLKALADGSVEGHGLYNTTWLEPSHLNRFSALLPHAIEADNRKLPVLLSQVCPERLARVAPIRLLLLPRVKDCSIARALPASKREALLALSPTSMIKMPVSGGRHFERISKLVENVPCYWLEFGADLRCVPLIVKDLLLRTSHL
jgi:hypothetical protein